MLAAGAANGQSYVDLHDFGAGLDGANPFGGVTFDSSGNMYGTTSQGGIYQAINGGFGGTVWEITAAGKYLDLHDFGSGSDGFLSTDGVAIDSSGNKFGTTSEGGVHGWGMVWEITAGGKYLDLHDFDEGSEAGGATPPAGVTVGLSGNLYGIAGRGGAYTLGVVWELTATGKYVDLHDFGAGSDGASPVGGVTVDGSGNLYGTTSAAGANGHSEDNPGAGMVWEITAAGKYVDLHDFGAGYDGANPNSRVTIDAAGNLFGTTNAGGVAGLGMAWELTSSGKYLDLHDFGANGDGSHPIAGVTIDGYGNLYGTASAAGANNAGSIWEITAEGQYIDLHDFEDGPIDGHDPRAGVTVDGAGNLLGTAFDGSINGHGMVWKITGAPSFSVTLSPNTVVGGTVTTGTVALSKAAPSGGATLYLSSTSANATPPNSVQVTSGSTSATFSIKTVAVQTQSSATISATLIGKTQSSTLTLLPPSIKSVTLNPTSVYGGATSNGTVTLSGPAPTGGELVLLKSGSAAATVPTNVSVTAGATSATFAAATTAVASSTNATISASLNGAGASATLTILPPVLQSLSLNPVAVASGQTSIGTVTLSGSAPTGGLAVTLASNSSAASVPKTVVVAAGQASGTFTVATGSVTTSTVATISATLGAKTASAQLTVGPVALLALTLNPNTVFGGGSVQGTLTLTGAAPAGGIAVNLSSSTSAATVPASITVPQGQASSSFMVSTALVYSSTQATISASSAKAEGNPAATLTIQRFFFSLAANPTVIIGGDTSAGLVQWLSKQALSKPETITLSTSSPSVTLKPSVINVLPGASSAPFSILTTAVASTLSVAITGVYSGDGSTRSIQVTVDPYPTLSSINLAPASVSPGASSTGTVTLTYPAPAAGLVVKLASSNRNATVPSSVTVGAGQTSATFAVTTSKAASAGTAAITATSGNVSKVATLTIS